MAHIVTNRGLQTLSTVNIGSADIRALVVTNASLPTDAAIRDMNFVSDLLTGGVTEAAVTNYARQDLGAVTVTEVDASDNVTITTAGATMNAVAAGETWAAVAYYIEGASDAARILLSVDKVATPVATNGGNMSIPGFSWTVNNP